MKIIECPRDAMQGIPEFIPTDKKTAYINSLLGAGFDTLDFGSFVSPKAIPQMSDTIEVLKGLDLDETDTALLSIVANLRGAEQACAFDEIRYLGYPFSISETFQMRNANSTIAQSMKRVEEIRDLCEVANKELVIYLSMAFGNPYGDKWDVDIAADWVEKLTGNGVKIISLADTTGVADPESISYLFSNLIPQFPFVEFGVHLHTHPAKWEAKVKAAYESGCRRFDSAIKGYGGCPMAEDRLVGNLATENLISFADKNDIDITIDKDIFSDCILMAGSVFPHRDNEK